MGNKSYSTVKTVISWIGLLSIQLMLLSSAALSQDVTGTVTDAQSGEILPGVNITVKGTTSGTSSGSEGKFTLAVPSLSDTLVFSFIGYQTREVPLEGRSEVKIALEAEAIAGEEVVVVGYGTQESGDVTGSVGSVNMEEVNNQPVTGGDQLMTGKISGVQVTQPAGVPGGGPTVQVRGLGAVGAGSQPLYVIDGFPVPSSSSIASNPLSDIPSSDIESINVLKDASATSIYGSRGANGVVLIETKDGRSGSMQVQVDAYTAVQQIPQKGRPDVMNAREFAEFRKEAVEDQVRFEEGREPTMEDIPEEYRDPGQYGEGTDWFEEVTRVAPMQNVTLSVSGGSDKVRSYISGGYLSQDGVLMGTGFERFSFRANVNADLSDKINVGLNLAPTYTKRSRSSIGGQGRNDGLGFALVASPIPPVYNDDGTYNEMIGTPGTFDYPNPVMRQKEVDNSSRGLRGLLSGYAEYNFIENFTARTSINIDLSNSRSSYFNPSTVGNLNMEPPVPIEGSYGEFTSINWASENTLSYENEFQGGHYIDGIIGFTVQEDNFRSANFTGEDFPDNDVRTLNAAARINGETGVESWSLVSYLGRVNYDYKDKYLLTGTIRRDGSSRFGSDNRWGLFPSGAIGWRISEESFMDDIPSVNDLKVRASYGITGNFNIGNYTHLSQIDANDYVFGGSLAPGKSLNALGNINLGWERTREMNFGVDLSLWEDKLQVNAEVYRKNTEDLLLSLEIPQSSGFSNVTENRGNVENRGLEVSVTSHNVATESTTWSTDFNISFNRNEVIELGADGDPILSGTSGEGNPTHITEVGQPVGMFYGYVFEGLYESESEIESEPSFSGAIPGNIKYRDVNGDGDITPVDDYEIIGNPYPDFVWGMTNSLSYKNFNLSLLVTGSYGGEKLKASNEYLLNIDGVFNVDRTVMDRWRSPDDPGDGQTPTTNGTGRSRVLYRDINSTWAQDNSHIWIKNVTLSYNFANLLSNERFRNATVYGSIQNALLISRYDGNPEVENYGTGGRYDSALTPGVDYTNYPVPRVISLGVKLGF